MTPIDSFNRDDWIPPSPEALFRYQVISLVRKELLVGRELVDAIKIAAAEPHFTLIGGVKRVSERSIYRWFRAYTSHGLKGLEPKKRAPLQGSRVLSTDLMQFIEEERSCDRDASLPELIKRARLLGIVKPQEPVNRVTLWRACKRLDIPTMRRKMRRDRDMRRFAYAQRMQMVLSDFVHFRAGITRARRLAVYLLDDATRYGLDVAVSTSENDDIFLLTLHAVLVRYGMMDAIYLDGGPAFISKDTARVISQLGIALIPGTAYYPEGHGKIERFNESVRHRLLRTLTGSVEIDSALSALTLRLRHDLFEIYNHTPHESLDNKTPAQCWQASRRLRPAPSNEWLKQRFTLTETRLVSKDHIISKHNIEYEVPRGYGGEHITIYRRILEGNTLYVLHRGRFVRLHPVDKYANATSRRGTAVTEEPEAAPHCKSSSTIAFEQAYGSILDTDGGFSDPADNTTKKE